MSMPQYRYTARDERGNAVTGTLTAPTPEALVDRLKHMGYLVTGSREIADGASLDGLWQRFQRIGYDDLVLFNVQLSKMVQVGIPLVTALDTLTRQTEHPRLGQVVGNVARSVEGGESFSEALGHHPTVFSELFVNMVRAGEASGRLDEVLRRLAEFAKHQSALRHQIQTAMAYPTVLLVAGIVVTTFLVTGIIPKFVDVFLEAGVPLPLPTFVLYQLSQLLRHYGIVLVGVFAMLAMGCAAYVRTPGGRRRLDTLLLALPVIGDIVRKAVLSRTARTLETLLSSGVPVLESLAITEQTCGNTVIADVMRNAQASVRQGGALSDPLRVSQEFPPMVVQMITVGEASGTLDHMLGEIASHYDELVEHSVRRLTTLIEPAFLVVMGGVVALIMASILLPMFRMVNVIH
jgi:type IV pilus assembly protein PilC